MGVCVRVGVWLDAWVGGWRERDRERERERGGEREREREGEGGRERERGEERGRGSTYCMSFSFRKFYKSLTEQWLATLLSIIINIFYTEGELAWC